MADGILLIFAASTSATYVIYTAQYDNNYSVSSGISTSDWTTCAEVYKQQLEAAYPTLTAALTDLCNANRTNNLFSLTVQGLTPATMSFHDGSNTVSTCNLFILFIYLFKQCLKRMTQLAINNYSTLWSSN